MPRRWTQGGDRRIVTDQRQRDRGHPAARSEPGLRKLIGITLVAMGGVAVLLGSQAPFMALGFALVFGLFALQAALEIPDSAARHIEDQSRPRS